MIEAGRGYVGSVRGTGCKHILNTAALERPIIIELDVVRGVHTFFQVGRIYLSVSAFVD